MEAALCKVYATDTFVRMAIDVKGVAVGFYGRKEKLLEQTPFSFWKI